MIRSKLLALKVPLAVVYEVTPVCDYDCSFCYAAISKAGRHPSFDQVKDILHRLAQAGVCRVTFMGGEFFLYPAWEEVLIHAQQLGLWASFISNGSRLTADICDRIARYVHSGAVSLHGPNAAVHDSLTRRKGSFARALRAIRACIQAGIPTGVHFTPTRNTYRHVWNMARGLSERDLLPNLINVSRLTPHGYALENWKEIRLDLQDYQQIFSQAARIHDDFGLRVRVGDGFPLCHIPSEWRKFAGRCDAGVTLAALGYQGDVKICPNSPIPLGNILDEDLSEIWSSNPMIELRELAWLPTECQKCASAANCKSGCIVSKPNAGYFSCDVFPPSSHQPPDMEYRQEAILSQLPGYENHELKINHKQVVRPRFLPEYRIREDIPGTIIVLESGAWFPVDDLGRVVVEICDGKHTRTELHRVAASNLGVAEEDIRERVEILIDTLAGWGLCAEGR